MSSKPESGHTGMHTTAPSAPADVNVGRVLRLLVTATFVVILNETILVNAIPRLMREFEVQARDAQWLSTSVMLTMAVVIPVTGWFLQRFTTRIAYGTAMGLFVLGTSIALVAPTFGVLLGARVVQAVGTAVMLPLLMTTLLTIVPNQDRGKVMGNVTLAMSVAPALGPTVSGFVLHLGSWRLIFAVVLPIAVAAMVLGLRELVDVGETRPGRVDVVSVLLSVVGFGGLVYGLSQLGGGHSGEAAGVEPPVPPLAVLVVGVLAVVGFVTRQLALQRTGEPLLDLRTLRFGPFAIGLALMCLSFMAMMGSVILIPLYLQDVVGLDALTTGLVVMPGGLAMGLLGPTVGRLYDRYGARPLVVPGAVGTALALGGLTLVGAGTSPWAVVGMHVLLSISLAAMFTPLFTSSLSVLPSRLYSHGSALLGSLQQVAAAAGTAVVVTVMSTRAAAAAADGASAGGALEAGVHWGFGVGAVISVLAVVLSVFVRTPVTAEGHGHGDEVVGDGDGRRGGEELERV